MADAGSLWVRLGLKNKDFKTGLDKSKAQVKGFGGVVSKLGPLMAGAFSVAIIARFGKEIFNLTAEFGSMMSRVQALTGASDELTKSLSEQAKTLGRETQFTASESAEAMTFLAQAGLSVNQIYKALPQTLELAAAGQIELAEAADISTNIMSAYGLQAEDLGRVNDIIVNTTTNANTNVREFAEAFKMVGPIAKAAGQEITDVSAMIGLLGNAGIKGTMAGTALRTMMAKLIAPTGDAAKILEKFEITTTKANGKLKPMNDLLIEMKKAGLSVADMFTVFDLRAAGSATVLKNSSLTFDDFLTKVERIGTAAEIAAKQMDNLKGDALKLDSAWKGLMLTMGQSSSGFMRWLTQDLTNSLQKISDLVEGVTPRFRRWRKSVTEMDLSGGQLKSQISQLTGKIEENETALESISKLRADGLGINKEFKDTEKNIEGYKQQLEVLEELLALSEAGISGKIVSKKIVPKKKEGGGDGLDAISEPTESSEGLLDQLNEYLEIEQLLNEELLNEIALKEELSEIDGIRFDQMTETIEQTTALIDLVSLLKEAHNTAFTSMASNAKAWAAGLVQATAQSGAGLKQFGNELRRAAKESISVYIGKAVASLIGNAIETSASLGPWGWLLAPVLGAAAAASANSLFDALIPSFETGTDFVPFTGMANLHKGEAVIPAAENRVRSRSGGGGTLSATITGEDIRFILDEYDRKTENSF